MPTNDRKSYLGYLNKLVSQCKNNYHQSFNKNPINASCPTLIEKTETNVKAPKFEVNDSVRITKYQNIFSKDYTKNLWRYLFIILGLIKLKI